MNKDVRFPFSIYRESGDGRLVNTRCNKDAMEIVEITQGEARVQIGTDVIDVSRGAIIYVPPSMMFRADAKGGNASVRGIIFDISIIEENMHAFDSELFDMFYIQSKNKLTVFESGHPVHKTLAVLIDECYEEYSAREVCYMLPIRARIYLMMTSLLRFYCGSKNELDRMIYHNVLRLRPVLNYITESFVDKIYIEKLSDMIGVSPDYFTKMFKESVGKTPIDYINAMRINYAMELLVTTDMPVADIAEKIGFCNPNYFHKIFKQYMDISPLAYRKSTK